MRIAFIGFKDMNENTCVYPNYDFMCMLWVYY